MQHDIRPAGIRRLVALAGLALGLLAAPSFADVLVVDDSGGADFLTIQAAVDAAAPGDLVLVRAGNYTGFDLDGKPLTLAGLGASSDAVQVVGRSSIRNIAADGQVLLTGMTLRAPSGVIAPPLGVGLVLQSSAGSLRVQDCLVLGGQLGSAFDTGSGDGGMGGGPSAAAIRVESCERVVLVSVNCEGAIGPSSDTGPAGVGGTGLEIHRSTVVTVDCHLSGGFGGTAFATQAGALGGKGGVGVHLSRHSVLHTVGGRIFGGWGGWSDEFVGLQSTGGDGLRIDADSQTHVRDTVISGGYGGFNVQCTCNGPKGEDVVGAGMLQVLPGTPPMLESPPNVLASGSTLILTGSSPLLVLAGLDPLVLDVSAAQGPLLVAPPWIGNGLLLPTLPWTADIPAPLGVEHLVLHLQAYSADGLGASRSLVLVDALP